MKKRILIINTGGTLSCIKTKCGYVPASGYVASTLRHLSLLHHKEMPEYTIKEWDLLLDSSNITVVHWNKIAQEIADNYAHFDGFVVFHGTDTMAYTASALSFMLENLDKPVILTGSQIPLSEVRNDAIDNVVTSLWICAHQPIHEVCIYFDQFLLRGNRSQKINSQGFKAFDSPNYPHLASIAIEIKVQRHLLLKPPRKPFHFQTIEPQFIANFRLFPGFAIEVLEHLLNQPLRGLILETYGAGNAPNDDPRFLKLLQDACARGIIIINCTQCQQGWVEMSQYATGYTLKKAGLISGHNMTPEAAHCKLVYLLNRQLEIPEIKKWMETDLRGELG